MRILVIGGTQFLGRHFVEAALEAGHDLTLFNRGNTNPEIFPTVEKIRGDRDGDLGALGDGRWDAVLDTCGYVPRVVRRSAEVLASSTGSYLFVSSVSAYADFSSTTMTEDAPLATMEDESVEEVNGATYGPLKVLCEQAVESVFGDRALIVRPGLIVGPHDPTDRFTWWPVRVARGGDLLAPGRPERTIQFIDARDLGAWMIRLMEKGASGPYNATGPETPVTMSDLVEACVAASASGAHPIWVPDEFLLSQGAGPWMELPLWIPESDESLRGILDVDVSKGVAEGLSFRPVDEIVRDTLSWARTRSKDHQWQAGIDPDKERSMLRAWSSS